MPIAAEWQRIKAIVAEALELDAPARAALIEAKCAGDHRVRAEVLALLAASDSTRGLLAPAIDAWLGLGDSVGLDAAGSGASNTAAPHDWILGRRVGPFTIERHLGSGAAASVYLATQDSPRRTVALKILRQSLTAHEGSARFAREAAALARLNHPGIARVYTAGVHREDAQPALPYIAIEHVDGPPITAFAAARALTTAQRMRLVVAVARAVHAAHQQAVIHRDLKPANVLVTPDGTPKVLDFGIAAILTPGQDLLTWHTIDGSLLGTPGYMSPEQARGEPGASDVRTDVWALGVLLYELLAARLPIDVSNCSLVESLRRVASQEPVPLQRVLPGIEPDLALVTMTAVTRDKDRRYASAEAFALDLERTLGHEPIAARPPSAWYRTTRFARRHRVGVAVAGGVLAALALLGGFAALQTARAIESGRRAAAVNQLLSGLLSAGDPTFGDRDARLIDVLDAAGPRLSEPLAGQPLVEADVRSALARMYLTLGEYPKAEAGFRRAVELRRRANRSDQRGELRSDIAGLANAVRWQFRYEEALALAEQALAPLSARARRTDAAALRLRQVVAATLSDQGQYDAADRAMAELIADAERTLSPRDEVTLGTKTAHTAVLNALGRYDESERLCRAIIEARRAESDRPTPELLTAQANLATLYSEIGRAADAVPILRQLADDHVRVVGPAHYNTLSARSNLAEALLRIGEQDEANELIASAAADASAAFGPTDRRTLHFISGQCYTLARSDRAADALPIARAALDACLTTHGPDDPTTTQLRQTNAAVLTSAGLHDQAAPLLEALYQSSVEANGPAHLTSMIQANNLGYCLIRAARPQDAVRLLAPVAELAREHNQPMVESVLRRNLGHALKDAARPDDAERELTLAWEMSTQRGEIDNARRAAELMAELLASTNRAAHAALWAARAAPAEAAP